MSWSESAALCPVQNRATCMAVATAANWIWDFLLAFFTPFITAAIDYRYGYIFAGCCLAMAATTYFFLLESPGARSRSWIRCTSCMSRLGRVKTGRRMKSIASK